MVVALVIAADAAAKRGVQVRPMRSIDDQRTENAISGSAAVVAKGISLLGSTNLGERIRTEQPLVGERPKTRRLPSLRDERGESFDAAGRASVDGIHLRQ